MILETFAINKSYNEYSGNLSKEEYLDNFNWVTGMFHETITNKINLDLNYNQLEDINQIKKLSNELKKVRDNKTPTEFLCECILKIKKNNKKVVSTIC